MFTQGLSEELERPDDFHVKRREGEAAEPGSRPDEWWCTGPAAGGSKLERTRKRVGATWYESATEKDSAGGRASGAGASQ
jgi:hypothetical protein